MSAKHRLVLFLFEVYKSGYRENYDKTDKLMERLLGSFTMRQRFDLIPKLLDFPFTGSYEFQAPNPFDLLDLDKKLTKDWVKPIIPAKKIDALLEQGLLHHRGARQWAISTLGKLHSLELLTPQQNARFSEVLWDRVDDMGLPDQTCYFKFGFIYLPHPDDIDPVYLFKNYIRGASFHKESTEATASGDNVHWSELVRREAYTTTSDNTASILRDIIGARGIEWSDKDIKSIFQKIIQMLG